MSVPKVSLIATTYNQPVDLDLYLTSLSRQTIADFQIVIADDGSDARSQEVVARHRDVWARERLLHVWHEDSGYRKAMIVNEGVRQSTGEWLIFTDSDHLVHPRFVEDHLSQRAARTLFMGRRVDLGRGISEWVRQHPKKIFTREFWLRVLISGWSSTPSHNPQRALRIANHSLAHFLKLDHVPNLLGSNFSMDRALFYEVNGFNEENEHYWGEDGDLFARVSHVGATIRGRKNFAVQLHLWHVLRSPLPDAEKAYREMLSDVSYRTCAQGLQSRSR